MPRPSRPWFRFYVEAMDDPKILRLSDSAFRVWVGVLTLARKSCVPGWLMLADGVPLEVEDIATQLRKPERVVTAALEDMVKLRLVEFDRGVGAWSVPAWRDRQFESDDVTVRTAKHRSNERRRNVPTSAVGTAPETETENRSIPPNPPQSGGLRGTGTSPRELRAAAEAEANARAIAERIDRDLAAFPMFCARQGLDDLEAVTRAARSTFADPAHQQRAVDGWRQLETTGGIHA